MDIKGEIIRLAAEGMWPGAHADVADAGRNSFDECVYDVSLSVQLGKARISTSPVHVTENSLFEGLLMLRYATMETVRAIESGELHD